MAANWGIFLCNCRHTLALDPQRFDLPILHVQFATHPDDDLQDFVDLANRERCTHAMIACCDSPARFEDALRPDIGPSFKTHFVDFKESCFAVHADPQEAHDKASRLLRAALQAAEVQTEPRYLPLRSDGRVLIVADEPLAGDLARRLGNDYPTDSCAESARGCRRAAAFLADLPRRVAGGVRPAGEFPRRRRLGGRRATGTRGRSGGDIRLRPVGGSYAHRLSRPQQR